MFQGHTPPVLVEHLGDAVEDAMGAGLIGETVVHGPGPSAHLPGSPLQDIGGADGFPALWRKVIKMQAVKEIFLHALHRPFFLYLPPGFPGLEALEGLFAAVGREDELGFLQAMSLVNLPDLHRHVAQLMSDTALHFDGRIDGRQGLDEAGVAVGNDELEVFPQKPPALEIGHKALPGLGVLHTGELEGEEFFAGLLLSWLSAMDPQGTEHHLFLDADLPDLAADTVQEEELHGIGQGLGAITRQLLVQAGQGIAHGLGADLLAEKFPGNGLQFPGADAIQKETAQGGIHIPAPVFMAVQGRFSITSSTMPSCGSRLAFIGCYLLRHRFG